MWTSAPGSWPCVSFPTQSPASCLKRSRLLFSLSSAAAAATANTDGTTTNAKAALTLMPGLLSRQLLQRRIRHELWATLDHEAGNWTIGCGGLPPAIRGNTCDSKFTVAERT